MLESLLISQALLWVVIIVLSVVCLALARQIGVIYERIAPAGALAMNQRLSGGDAAPKLTLTTLAGESITIGSRQLLFFLSPTCPICKKLLPILKSIHKSERQRVDIILASDGDDEESHRRFVKAQGLEGFHYVISQGLGMAYGVGKLPYSVLIDERGIINALGIVNTREHLESLFEAQALGKSTIQQYLHGHAETEARHDERVQHESV